MNQSAGDKSSGEKAKSPKWTGKLIDAFGRVGRLRVDVASESSRGTFELELLERDGKPNVLRGQVTLMQEGKTVRIRSSFQSEQRESKLEWDATLTRAEAGR